MVIQFEGNETPAQRRRRIWAKNLRDTLEVIGPMTPKEFHKALRDAGAEVSIQAVYRWLNGEAAPSPEHQLIVAQVTRSPHHLMFPINVQAAA